MAFSPAQFRGQEMQNGVQPQFPMEDSSETHFTTFFRRSGLDRASVGSVEALREHVLVLTVPPTLLYAPVPHPTSMK